MRRGVSLVVAVPGRSYSAGTADDDVGREGVAGAETSTAGGTDEGVGGVAAVEGQRGQYRSGCLVVASALYKESLTS